MAHEAADSDLVVGVPIGETWIIKQVLDAGAQTVLVPIVESAEQAEELVRACKYPPHATRDSAAAQARLSPFGSVRVYIDTAV